MLSKELLTKKNYIKATLFEAAGNMTLKKLRETILILCYMSLLIPVKRMHIDTHFTKDHLKMFMLIFVNMILSVKEFYIYRHVSNFTPCRHPTKKVLLFENCSVKFG